MTALDTYVTTTQNKRTFPPYPPNFAYILLKSILPPSYLLSHSDRYVSVFSVLGLHTRGLIQYVWVYLLLLSPKCWRVYHVAVWVWHLFLFSDELYSFSWICHNLFVHSSITEHLGCLLAWAIMNKSCSEYLCITLCMDKYLLLLLLLGKYLEWMCV